MKKLLLIFATALTLVFAGCESFGGDDVVGGSYNINGAIQKGPFVQGSNITIQPLNTNLKPIGKVYNTQTINDAGMFELDGINYKYVEIIATGYYFDEVEGEISAGPLTLRSIADLKESVQTNVNLLTTLTYNRIKNLVTNEGKEIAEAQKQAEKELYTALGIPENSHPDVSCGSMNIANNGEGDGLLLAISVALQYGRNTGELSELIAKISSDFANDGLLSSSLLQKLIQSESVAALIESVTGHLTDRYLDLGISGVVPPFASYLRYFQDIDQDGTGDADKFAILEYTYIEVSAVETCVVLPFSYVDMESCEISISDNTPEAKEWATLTIDGDKCLVSVKANTTESERYCDIVIKDRYGDDFITFTIEQTHAYSKLTYTTSDGSMLYNHYNLPNILEHTYTDGVGVILFTSPLTSIGERAFEYCHSLTSITIPDSVTSIGNYAFSNCTSLTSITIPDGVTSIGDGVFYYCLSLAEFRGKFASEDGRCLIVDGVLKSFAPAGLTEYTIPDSVTEIGNSAFGACTSLTSITIPDSVTTIGDSAFDACHSLTSITIPDSVTSIGNYAFYCCSQLTSVTIGDSVTSIGSLAFSGCDSLSNFYGKFASEDGRCLIVDGVLNSFARAGLTEYTIPDSVTSIGEYAFYGCDSLTSITIPDSVTSIGTNAFFLCSSLTYVTIGSGVTEIGLAPFGVCESLAEFRGKFASEDGRCLIVDGVLNSFAPAGLTEYTIPDSVTSIGHATFANLFCPITSITIPDSVTKIEYAAFASFSSLVEVYCKPTTPPSGGNYMFEDNAVGRKIYVPTESVNAYKAAENWNNYANAIVGYDFE